MTDTNLKTLLTLMANLPAGKEVKWNPGLVLMYTIGLSELPDEACEPLAKAITTKLEWRPTVATILKMWRDISQPPAMSATDAMVEVQKLVRYYGAAGARHPDFPERFPNIRTDGPPEELKSLPAAVQLTIQAFGGWVAMCQEDVEPMVYRAQFERLYKSACDGEGDSAMREIRKQYLLENPTRPLLEDGDDDES